MYVFYVQSAFEVGGTSDDATEAAPQDSRRQQRVRWTARAGDSGAIAAGGSIALRPASEGRVSADTLYFCYSRPFLHALASAMAPGAAGAPRVLGRRSAAAALSALGMPPRLGVFASMGADLPLEAQLRAAAPHASPRLAIITPFGHAYGDTLVQLAALRAVVRHVRQRRPGATFDLLRHPDNAGTDALFLAPGLVGRLRDLPAPLAVLGEYDAYFDLTNASLDDSRPWFDEMLRQYSLGPEAFPHEDRLPWLPGDFLARGRAELGEVRPPGERRPLMLIHPTASTPARSMPAPAFDALACGLVATGRWRLVTASIDAPRHAGVTSFASRVTEFAHLAAVVSRVDAVLTTDTVVCHLAIALNVPGVTVFTTVAPESRISYAPAMHGVDLGAECRTAGGHTGGTDAACARCWGSTAVGRILDALAVLR